MAIWPFGRKSKKTSHSADDPAMPSSKKPPPERSRTEPTALSPEKADPTLTRRSSPRESQKRPRSTSRKLSKSNAPSSRNLDKVESLPPIPALPDQRRAELSEKRGLNKSNQMATNAPSDRGDIPSYYFQNPMSNASLQPEKFTVSREPPTLQNKRSANDSGLLRRKSSRKKASDHAREREIKAMSSPIPIPKRPKSYQTDMLARDSVKVPGALNRNLERPLSDVSLPLAESMASPSQMSLSSPHNAPKVSAFNALSPRPTIKYSSNPRSPATSLVPSRTSTRKDKQAMILEADEPLEKSRKRIDDLADHMDSGSLRELMERDRRRLDKRRKSENERLQRRLQRKAEKQRQEEQAAAGTTTAPSEDVGLTGLGIESPTIAAGSLHAPTGAEGARTPDSWFKDLLGENVGSENPFRDPFEGASTSHLEEATPTEEREEPTFGTAKAIRLSSASMSPPTSPTRRPHESKHVHEPSNLSQFSEIPSSSTPDIPENDLYDHRQGRETGALSTSWKSIFRRSNTRTKRESADRGRLDRGRGRGTPSEFSNSSRESVARQMPPPSYARAPRVRSDTPIRSQSIFKEDLPESSVSPPGSRQQSPEAAPSQLPGIPGSRGTDVVASSPEKPLSEIHPAYREEVALSRQASLRAKSPEEPQSATLSESLASVDAEGSWLTGRPVKRTSTPQPLRDSQRIEDPDDSDDDGPGTPPAEKYMGSLTPARSVRSVRSARGEAAEEGPSPPIPQRRRPYMSPASGSGRESDEETSSTQPIPLAAQDEGTTWHSAIGKHPTIVRQGPGPRMKSTEGLLNDFQAAEAAPPDSPESSPSENSPVSPEGPLIQRATSVDFGRGHARHISAGSARLLNLPPRNSSEMKRLSSSSVVSGERSPLAQSPRLPETHDNDVD